MSTAPNSRENPTPLATANRFFKQHIQGVGTVWIEAEITQWKPNKSGHIYAKFKDLEQDSAMSTVLWRSTAAKLTETFTVGDRVVAQVRPDYYEPSGSVSFIVNALAHTGVGDLLARIERLRQQLTKEGLFDAAHKKPLPFLPRNIGLITGRNSDAEKDVVRNATLRWPDVRFTLAHAAVQGENAVPELIAALETLDGDPEVDLIIIARGGGELLHLLPFYDERLVRAAFAARTPIISAIGHEADRPLLDEVADLRASTPTDAAKRAVPDVSEERAKISEARARITRQIRQRLADELAWLHEVRNRPALRDPLRILQPLHDDLERTVARLGDLVTRGIENREHDLTRARSTLRALSPKHTLERGYAIVQNSHGAVVVDPAQVPTAERLTVTVAAGKFGATATEKEQVD